MIADRSGWRPKCFRTREEWSSGDRLAAAFRAVLGAGGISETWRWHWHSETQAVPYEEVSRDTTLKAILGLSREHGSYLGPVPCAAPFDTLPPPPSCTTSSSINSHPWEGVPQGGTLREQWGAPTASLALPRTRGDFGRVPMSEPQPLT